ncbi:cobalamin-binding protein [Yimella sp. cx-51]|nr:cobalamin-binding protein [Yimella sp. cx-51]
MTDDLGFQVELPDAPVRRVVSLVPSLTEAIAATTPDALVGATDWCTHPAALDVPRVRGTKNPDLAAITALDPELVVANKEENRELDVKRLRDRGITVWVTDIETVPQALGSMRRLFTGVLGWDAPEWLDEADHLWQESAGRESELAESEGTRGVVVPIWRDPWMVVGHPTYTADLLARLGYEVVVPDGAEGRYPHAELSALDSTDLADLVLLPDEPYVFTPDDGPEAFTAVPTRLISGRLITWYGPAMVEAAKELPGQLR